MSEVKIDKSGEGYINWWEFAPQDNILVIKTTPNKMKTETESGIIISMNESKLIDRSYFGEVMSKGPNVKNVEVGNIVYFPPNNTFDMGMVRSQGDESYVMTTSDRIDGIKVKDVRIG